MTNRYPDARYPDDGDRHTQAYSQEQWQQAQRQAPGQYQPPVQQQAQRPGQAAAQRQAPPADQVVINNQQFVAGVLATALVAAVAGFVVTAIIKALYTNNTDNQFGSIWGDAPQDVWATALIGGLGALVAGGLLWVFLTLTPSPMTFFQWIVGLCVFAAVVLPFLGSGSWQGALITGLVNAFLGVLVLSLLVTVGRKTARIPAQR